MVRYMTGSGGLRFSMSCRSYRKTKLSAYSGDGFKIFEGGVRIQAQEDDDAATTTTIGADGMASVRAGAM